MTQHFAVFCVPIDPFIERAGRGIQSEAVNTKKRIKNPRGQ